ncbi:putative F-box protein At4g38870 [Aegilops tauschii subsp. strangulata]|nr:putative F-box protein At4g21240 [Aegilops tauschii subsp. strangulata]
MPLHPPKRQRSSASSPPVVATSNDGVLPLDLLYDILLRLPAETLCRLRAVCRSWRSLLSHPDFIAGARNPGPLIAVGIKDEYLSEDEVTVLDMDCGDAVTRVNIAANDLTYGEAHSVSHDGVVCILGPQNRLRLLDLPNGSVFLLPDHAPLRGHKLIWCTVGGAASTVEHKVLAIATFDRHEPFVCEILTLGLSNGGWRDIESPPLALTGAVTVINGVAYSLSRYATSNAYRQIMAFDFNKEAWRSTSDFLRGPANCRCIVSLAELEGHLVACHATNRLTSSIELWFLMDSDRSLWFKR